MASTFSPQVGPRWGLPTPQDFFIEVRQAIRYVISGITQDSTGAALGSCAVSVFETIPNAALNEPQGRLVGMTVSDAAGNYSVDVTTAAGTTFFVVAYKAGAPDVMGTTVNTLIGSYV